jgi:hypothetical protein
MRGGEHAPVQRMHVAKGLADTVDLEHGTTSPRVALGRMLVEPFASSRFSD